MKKVYFIAKCWFLLLTCLCFSNCKKNVEQPIDKSNIVLYDKPLSVIQECIRGKWKLEYEKGGICGCVFPSKDSFFLYATLSPKRIILKNSVEVTLDTTITWKPTIFSNKSTYVMNFYSSSGIIFNFAAEGVFNDTLVLFQPTPDGVSFYYSKSN